MRNKTVRDFEIIEKPNNSYDISYLTPAFSIQNIISNYNDNKCICEGTTWVDYTVCPSRTNYSIPSSDFYKVQRKTTTKIEAEGEQSITYSDYKEVNGILFPQTISYSMGGLNLEGKLKSIEVNSKIEDSKFN